MSANIALTTVKLALKLRKTFPYESFCGAFFKKRPKKWQIQSTIHNFNLKEASEVEEKMRTREEIGFDHNIAMRGKIEKIMLQ